MGVFDGFNLAGSAADSIGSLIGGGISSIFANQQRKKNVQAQKELMDYQADINQNNILNGALWRKQSLQRAGLSSASVDGQFNAATASIPGAAGATNVDTKSPFTFEAIQAAKDSHNTALKQQDLLEKQAKNFEEDTRGKVIENDNKQRVYDDKHAIDVATAGMTEAQKTNFIAQANKADMDAQEALRRSDLILQQINTEKLNQNRLAQQIGLDKALNDAHVKYLGAQAYAAVQEGKLSEEKAKNEILRAGEISATIDNIKKETALTDGDISLIQQKLRMAKTDAEKAEALKPWNIAQEKIGVITGTIKDMADIGLTFTKTGALLKGISSIGQPVETVTTTENYAPSGASLGTSRTSSVHGSGFGQNGFVY